MPATSSLVSVSAGADYSPNTYITSNNFQRGRKVSLSFTSDKNISTGDPLGALNWDSLTLEDHDIYLSGQKEITLGTNVYQPDILDWGKYLTGWGVFALVPACYVPFYSAELGEWGVATQRYSDLTSSADYFPKGVTRL